MSADNIVILSLYLVSLSFHLLWFAVNPKETGHLYFCLLLLGFGSAIGFGVFRPNDLVAIPPNAMAVLAFCHVFWISAFTCLLMSKLLPLAAIKRFVVWSLLADGLLLAGVSVWFLAGGDRRLALLTYYLPTFGCLIAYTGLLVHAFSRHRARGGLELACQTLSVSGFLMNVPSFVVMFLIHHPERRSFSIASGIGLLPLMVCFDLAFLLRIRLSFEDSVREVAERQDRLERDVSSFRERCAGLGLSTRETEVAIALVSGIPAKLIAKSLGISWHTVRSVRRSIYLKTGVRSLGELVAALAP